MNQLNDQITSVIVTGRDKFSPTDICLESILENTGVPCELIVVLGGAPESVKKRLLNKFQGQAQFYFEDEFLNQPQGRNIGLKHASGKYSVVMDNDVLVRPGWLKAMLKCAEEEKAAMVSPIVLEEENVIHCAGNDLYITSKNGKKFGHKVLRYHSMIVEETTNLERSPVDYAELHCQLVDTKTARDLHVFDEKIREVGECDSGLVWKKHNCKMMFEPGAAVYYYLYHPVRPEDLKFFIWRWDMRGILEGYEHFEKKWNIDISEHGSFRNFLLRYNGRVGFWARLYPCTATFYLDKMINRACGLPARAAAIVQKPWRRYLAKRLGYDDWAKYAQV